MVEFSEHDVDMASRIARIEAKLDALGRRMDDAVLIQVKDHGKRLAFLERRAVWTAGWTAGAACAASALTAVVVHFMGLGR